MRHSLLRAVQVYYAARHEHHVAAYKCDDPRDLAPVTTVTHGCELVARRFLPWIISASTSSGYGSPYFALGGSYLCDVCLEVRLADEIGRALRQGYVVLVHSLLALLLAEFPVQAVV